MTAALAAGLVALSCTVSAVLVRRDARTFAALLGVAAATLSLAAAASLLDAGVVAAALLVVVAAVVTPLALSAYPVPAWSDPATWLLAALGVACAAVAVASPRLDVDDTAGLVLVLGLVAAGWWRIERAGDPDRQLLLWQAFVVALAVLAPALAEFATNGTGLAVAATLGAAVVPPALAAGLLRRQREVRALVVPVVVGALAGAGYVGVLVTTWKVVRLTDVSVTDGGYALLGFLLALAVAPTTRALRGVVDEVLFGRRPDPLVAARRAAGAIGAAGDDLGAALDAVREALVLPSLVLRVGDEDVAGAGDDTWARTEEVPAGGDPPVVLRVGLRPAEARLGGADADVLRVVGPLLAQTVHAHRLAAELHASRGRVITAVEEERRRLRHDLHDGLGPRLSGMAFTTDAARNVLAGPGDGAPAAAAALLADVRAYAVAAVEEVRGLVAGLRPPALDELGLAGALRQHAADVRRHDGLPLTVTVDAGDLGEVPAATEVAAYRIAVEALTNVARHARATAALVDLDREADVLTLTVTDDDRTATDVGWTPGVGLTSMGQRAEALGGSLAAGPTPDGGRVHARIPTRNG
ncbi:histidine kinase [Nocardioides sp. CFH 31398]|uniref:sensor histidine kinase n=1 Tax=Nocardioides sp. CFH 31398 TaxID=2919579 RepID=UPI001F06E8A5|nr:histidine kinase [Nocardioides sp. CFH 31398]MCH1864982.1 histidine kinase [Nocardioides sp. CFH 31398]